MTKEQAINYLYSSGMSDEQVNEVVKALEQEPCEDCISRRATVERLCKVADFMNEKREGLGSPYIMAALFIQDNKDEFPPVTPQQKTGHWIQTEEKDDAEPCILWECSCCHKEFRSVVHKVSNYCPKCGCRMVEPQERSE